MISITSKILIIDRNKAYTNLLRNRFPNLKIEFFNCRNNKKKIDLIGVDIVFFNILEQDITIYKECFYKVKWIFLVTITKEIFQIEMNNYIFLIDSGWTKIEMLEYISKSFTKIELGI